MDLTRIIDTDGKIIMYTDCPSVGDYLMMSNLPELWFEKYGVYSYISSECKFHLEETYDLIFKFNPYVKGFSEEKYNVLVDCRLPPPGIFMAKTYMDRFNLIGNEVPKLYYEPKKQKQYENVILSDIASRNYSSDVTNLNGKLEQLLNNLLKENPKLEVRCIRYKNPDNRIHRYIPKIDNIDFIEVENIFDYCDIVNSVKFYVGVNSGSSLLSSSIKEYYNKNLHITLYSPDNAKQWIPRNIDSIITVDNSLK